MAYGSRILTGAARLALPRFFGQAGARAAKYLPGSVPLWQVPARSAAFLARQLGMGGRQAATSRAAGALVPRAGAVLRPTSAAARRQIQKQALIKESQRRAGSGAASRGAASRGAAGRGAAGRGATPGATPGGASPWGARTTMPRGGGGTGGGGGYRPPLGGTPRPGASLKRTELIRPLKEGYYRGPASISRQVTSKGAAGGGGPGHWARNRGKYLFFGGTMTPAAAYWAIEELNKKAQAAPPAEKAKIEKEIKNIEKGNVSYAPPGFAPGAQVSDKVRLELLKKSQKELKKKKAARKVRKEEKGVADAATRRKDIGQHLQNQMRKDANYWLKPENQDEKIALHKEGQALGDSAISTEEFNRAINQFHGKAKVLEAERVREKDRAEGRAWLNEKLDEPRYGSMVGPTASGMGRNVKRFMDAAGIEKKTPAKKAPVAKEEKEKEKKTKGGGRRKAIEREIDLLEATMKAKKKKKSKEEYEDYPYKNIGTFGKKGKDLRRFWMEEGR